MREAQRRNLLSARTTTTRVQTGAFARQRSAATPVSNGHSCHTQRETRHVVILSEARHWRSQWLAQSTDPSPADTTTAPQGISTTTVGWISLSNDDRFLGSWMTRSDVTGFL
jgi:hypothetical protein